MRRTHKTKIVVIIYGMIILSLVTCNGGGGTGSGSHTLAWDAPTQYTDGSPLSVAGYKLYYGTASRSYSKSLDVGNVTSYSISLPSGSYYAAVTAYDSNGFESDYSNEVSMSY